MVRHTNSPYLSFSREKLFYYLIMRTHIQKIVVGVLGLVIVTFLLLGSQKTSPTVQNEVSSTTTPDITTNIEVHNTAQEYPTKKITPEVAENTLKEPITVTLAIPQKTYETSVENKSSVYELMEHLRNTQGLLFESEYYTGMGFFITSLSGTKQNPKNSDYWTLYINGKESQTGVSSALLKNGDSAEWKLENRNNL